MSAARVHLRPADARADLVLGACGFTARDATHLTNDRAAVTCRACVRLLDRETIGHRDAKPSNAIEPFAPGPAVPVERQSWDDRGPAIVERSIAGDDGAEREGWRTLNGALAAWWAVSGSSLVASSSRPPSSGSGSRTDHMPAAIAHRTKVLPVERAIDAACAPGRSFTGDAEGKGALELDARACRFVVECYLAGRSAGDTAARLASAMRLADDAITAHQVGLVWRGVRAEVERALRERGLLRSRAREHTQQRESSSTEGEPMAHLPGHELEGYKGIAAYLGVSETTVKRIIARAAAENPLRVARYLGGVYASKAEVDAWRTREAKVGSAA